MRLGPKHLGRHLMMGLATCALLAVGTVAEAQRTVRNTPGPAEMPPASYTAAQYVDSRGCVFIRAGVGGATRWVPRVNRDRTVVCGQPASRPATVAAVPTQRPTAAPTVQVAEPVIARLPAAAAPREIVELAPRVAPAPPVTNATAPRRQVVRAAPRPIPQRVATAPRRTALPVPPGCGASDLSARYLRNTPACAAALRGRAASAPNVTATAAPTVSTEPATPRRAMRRAPVAVAVTPPAGALRVNPAAPSPNRASGPAPATRGCSGASDLSSRYLRNATRCGGDGSWSVLQRSSVDAPGRAITTVSTRTAPRTVLVPAARTTFDVTTPPPGYRAAFDDGRLNPNRGPRTLEGDFQSQAIWTNETPRRLRSVILVQR